MEIRAFQQLIRDIYFHRDHERGIKGTFIWFVEEVGELAEAIGKYDLNSQNERLRENVGQELADVFAWGVSLANLLNIDLEKAIEKKYPNTCLKCHTCPCSCKPKGELS